MLAGLLAKQHKYYAHFRFDRIGINGCPSLSSFPVHESAILIIKRHTGGHQLVI